jgi:hypothetical protein
MRRSEIAEVLPDKVCEDVVTFLVDEGGSSRKRIDRRIREMLRQHFQAGPMIRMPMGEDDAIHRLTKRGCVGCDLFSVRIQQLSIEDDQLGWAFDNLRVNEPSVRRSDIGVNADAAALGYDHCSFAIWCR